MAIADVVGNEMAKEILLRAYERGKLSHAYLFTGPEGVGKFLLAKEFAKLLACESPIREGRIDSCGVCRSCRMVEARTHPDVRFIEPRRATAAFGAESVGEEIGEGATISIGQVRELRGDAGLRPYMAKWKVYIIRDADRMTPEAGNSLLKTLEEPNPGVVIILTTANPSGLLPTIVSRCQEVLFRSVPVGEVESLLMERHPSLRPSQVALVALLSGGRPGEAIKWAETPELFELRERALTLLCREPASNLAERLKVAEELIDIGAQWWRAKRGLDIPQSQMWKFRERLSRLGLPEVLDLGALWFRDVIVVSTGARVRLANVDLEGEVREVAARIGAEKGEEAIRAISEAKANIMRNANMMLEMVHLLHRLSRILGGRGEGS